MTDTIDIQALARGIHEVLILAVLRHGPKHGYQIALDVEEETGGVFAFQHGTLYPILHRLERDGRIAGRWDRGGGDGGGGGERGGRRRKVYALTAAGRSHLAEESDRIRRAHGALERLLGGSA